MGIAEKIAALLAKANGTDNEHEQEAFATKARELMEKHGIKEADLENDKLSAGDDEFSTLADLKWQTFVVDAVGAYFDVLVVHRRDFKKIRYAFYGRESNRLTCEHMLPYVFEQIRRQADKMTIATGATMGAACRAIGLALVDRLSAAVSDEVRKYAESVADFNTKNTNFSFSGSAKAYADKISMNKQAGSNAPKTIAATH